MERWNVGVLVFDGVAAPRRGGPVRGAQRARLEPGVESRRTEDGALFDVFTVAKTKEPVTATGGLVLVPRHSFADAPGIDLLLVPGGFGTRPAAPGRGDDRLDPQDRRRRAAHGLGLHRAPCCWPAPASSTAAGPRPTGAPSACSPRSAKDVTVDREARFVDDGVLTSAGVASGMDLALHVVETLVRPRGRRRDGPLHRVPEGVRR